MASLDKKLYRGWHARAAGIVVGLGVALLVSMLGTLGILANERRQAVAVQALTADRLKQVVVELNQAFSRLEQSRLERCSEETLTHLRGLLLQYRYLRDVGIVDARDRILCTTSGGLLSEPTPLPTPTNVTRTGFRNWLNYSVGFGEGRVVVSLTARGNFMLMVDSHANTELMQHSGIDSIWMDSEGVSPGKASPVWRAPRVQETEPWAPLHSELGFSSQQQFWSRIDWRRGVLALESNVPGTGYFIQNKISLRELFRNNSRIFSGLVLLAFLTGGLAGGLAHQRARLLRTLPYRIADLCRPENIICMYQPIMELTTGRVAGCEVLMRLRDGGEVIYPDKVIPLILERSLGWQLDQAVSLRALRELADALPKNPVSTDARLFKVAINFFPENIRFEKLTALLTPIRPEGVSLNVEVTEYGMSDDLFEEVRCLREADYLISVDDFGTGYSNLGTVKCLSPDFLKIDKSFVFDMEDDSLRSSLIPEIVAIARAVNAELIAEGVENEQQANRLRDMGVQYGQGYFFARPLPIEEFMEFLAKATSGKSA
ncbi:EAL domain-containing protein [Uliginosibacterium aquaticum]|uniref:cyclic-guanylate-specific phosphodiesterase n=1 Tax=Uliginosibacterium aquaticum TaxID=2731212 RepID=A0ABX2IE56_9RHOO|nr:EAL domain-containing protein [Uliginosibacterium aquaticum]NSL54919.1 EAL domain-containing protein [Uliginosibacterium aquaticum]